MTALNTAQQANLNMSLRNSTPMNRLNGSEVDAVIAAAQTAGFQINAIASSGGQYIGSDAEFNNMATALRSGSPASRLSHTEVFQALKMVKALDYPISRPFGAS